MNVDVWDITTWQDLRKTKQALLDTLFDEADTLTDNEVRSIERQLSWIQDDLDAGITRQIPF